MYEREREIVGSDDAIGFWEKLAVSQVLVQGRLLLNPLCSALAGEGIVTRYTNKTVNIFGL